MEIIRAYIDMLVQYRNVDIQKLRHHSAQQFYEISEKKFYLGGAAKTDLHSAKSNLAIAESELYEAEDRVSISKAKFYSIAELQPDHLLYPELPLHLLPDTIEDLLDKVSQDNYVIKRSKHETETSLYTTNASKGKLLPSIDISASLSQDKRDINQAFKSTDRDRTLNVAINIPVFHGGARYATVRKNQHELESKKLSEQAQYNDVTYGAAESWNAMHISKKNLDSLDKAIEHENIVIDGMKEEYELGAGSLVSILQEEDKLYRYKLKFLDYKRQYIINCYAILNHMGVLTAKGLELDTDIYDPNDGENGTNFLSGVGF